MFNALQQRYQNGDNSILAQAVDKINGIPKTTSVEKHHPSSFRSMKEHPQTQSVDHPTQSSLHNFQHDKLRGEDECRNT